MYLSRYIGLPSINSLDSLADNIQISKQLLVRLVNRADYHYREYTIPKKSGGLRLIAAPSRELKAVQAWILRKILQIVDISEHATAFKLNTNIESNVKPHLGNSHFLVMDLRDFFPTIGWKYVYSVFKTLGYSAHISRTFTNLCTYKGSLPQGGVTSPYLSNIVCIKLDNRISGYTSTRNVTYTRYADDLTFSSTNSNRLVGAKKVIQKIVSEEGFQINLKKTRFMGPGTRCLITGLVIQNNGRRYGIGRSKERILRAKVFRLLNSKVLDASQVESVRGWYALLSDIDENRFNRLTDYRTKLARRIKIADPVALK